MVLQMLAREASTSSRGCSRCLCRRTHTNTIIDAFSEFHRPASCSRSLDVLVSFDPSGRGLGQGLRRSRHMRSKTSGHPAATVLCSALPAHSSGRPGKWGVRCRVAPGRLRAAPCTWMPLSDQAVLNWKPGAQFQ